MALKMKGINTLGKRIKMGLLGDEERAKRVGKMLYFRGVGSTRSVAVER
jgi:hypothetical protein